MKKFSLLILSITFYLGVNAQIDSTHNNLNRHKSFNESDARSIHHDDGYMMKNGKMVMVKNGKVTPMDKDINLPGGIVITINGSYKKKNGAKKMLRDGEHVNMMGEIIPMNNAKDSVGNSNWKSNNSVEPTQKSIDSSKNKNPKSKKNNDMILIPDSTRKKKTW